MLSDTHSLCFCNWPLHGVSSIIIKYHYQPHGFPSFCTFLPLKLQKLNFPIYNKLYNPRHDLFWSIHTFLLSTIWRNRQERRAFGNWPFKPFSFLFFIGLRARRNSYSSLRIGAKITSCFQFYSCLSST